MIESIKILLGLTDYSKDTVLQTLIDMDTEYVLSATHRTELTPQLEKIIISCVVWDYNQMDSIGIESESYSGLSFNYQQQYPENIQRMIIANRKLRVI